MKKCLIFLVSFLTVSFLHAARDSFSSDRPAMWRSSRTDSADSMVLLASGPIHFHGIRIDSPTLNIGDSRISLYNSTTPATSLFNFNITTAIGPIDLGARLYENVVSSGSALSKPEVEHGYDCYFSSGLVYDKKASSIITILWDFVAPNINYQLIQMSP